MKSLLAHEQSDAGYEDEGFIDPGTAVHWRYNADTSQLTVYQRHGSVSPLCTITVSIPDSHALMKAIDKMCDQARDSGIRCAMTRIQAMIDNEI